MIIYIMIIYIHFHTTTPQPHKAPSPTPLSPRIPKKQKRDFRAGQEFFNAPTCDFGLGGSSNHIFTKHT